MRARSNLLSTVLQKHKLPNLLYETRTTVSANAHLSNRGGNTYEEDDLIAVPRTHPSITSFPLHISVLARSVHPHRQIKQRKTLFKFYFNMKLVNVFYYLNQAKQNRKFINVRKIKLTIYHQNHAEFMPASHPVPSLPRSFNFCGNLVESRERRPRTRPSVVRPSVRLHAAAVERRRSTPAATLICEVA